MSAGGIIRPAGRTAAVPAANLLHKLVLPSTADLAFVAVLFWLFFFGSGAPSLLSDGDTGWHIHTGHHVLSTGQFPHFDLFSFSMQGKRWFAWEWLADVALALAHRAAGLQGVVLLAGVVIAATAAALLRFMVWQGTNLLLAIVAMLAVCSASMVHWLARPHMFTWGFLLATVWLLEADRRQPGWRVYWLVPLVAVWVNVHGGFAALLVTVAIYAAGGSLEQIWDDASRHKLRWAIPPAARRYGLLLLLCMAATLVNPYTYDLHRHIWAYLQSDFILNHVQEFQSPDFRGESMKVYEAALFGSVLLAGWLLRRRQVTPALLVLAWAHASLLSVRHVPLFMIVAVPVLAREASSWISEGARQGNSWLKALQELADDYGGGGKAASERGPIVLNVVGVAAIVTVAVLLQARAGQADWKAEFPSFRFPALAADSIKDRLVGRRVLSTDQWSDYLVYRFHPEFKAFIDGRSDFYDPRIRDEYLQLMGSHWEWESILARHEFDAALLPVDWSLTAALKSDPKWRLTYDDGAALLFERAPQTPGEQASGAGAGSDPASASAVARN